MNDNPRLEYTGQSNSSVNAAYAGMPTGTNVAIIDTTSGTALVWNVMLEAGGSGNVSLIYDASTPAGDYHLVAQDSSGTTIAESIGFYIDPSNSG